MVVTGLFVLSWLQRDRLSWCVDFVAIVSGVTVFELELERCLR